MSALYTRWSNSNPISEAAEPDHWSERGRVTLVADANAVGRPRRSVFSFGESMSAVTENESWVVDRGALVIEKKAQSGADSLNEWERLVYCLWLADYMMRNAGDFANVQ